MHKIFGEKWPYIQRMVDLWHLKPILKYKIGVVNPKVSSLVAFDYFFSEWLAIYTFPSVARAVRHLLTSLHETGLTKLAQLMLIG